MDRYYPHLFSPIKLGDVLVQNRIVANPMGDSYEDKSLGGAGIVICGHVIVEEGRSSFMSGDEPYGFSKYQVEEVRHRMLIAQRTGARTSIELHHSGVWARVRDFAMGPDSYVRADGTEVRAMTPEMMEHTASCWARAAHDAQDIGYDMVFLHFGHGWLATNFLSPRYNHRNDEYGGSIENRMRFPLQILRACREAVGPDFPMEMRISAYEWMPGSMTLEDVIAFCKEAQRYVTSIQVSSGLDLEHEANVHMAASNLDPHLGNAVWCRAIKEAIGIPVTLVGSIETPEEAERLIAEGTCDMVAMARALAADPFWPAKARDGRVEDIVPCIRCLQCYHIASNRRNVGCSVNPRYANEGFVPLELAPAREPKDVLVVGAGPAGIKAALTAAERGHRVMLADRADEVGGQLRLIAQEDNKEDIARYLSYLQSQVAKADIELRSNLEVTPELVRSINPDALIIAVGASPVTPRIPGFDGPNVVGFSEAIERSGQLGGRVSIIGAGTIGAEIALEEAERGADVTLIEAGDTVARTGNMLYRIALRQRMDARAERLHVLMEASCSKIGENELEVVLKDGGKQTVPFDSCVMAVGVRSNSDTVEALFGLAPQCFVVGDCKRPRIIKDAVYEGYAVAAAL